LSLQKKRRVWNRDDTGERRALTTSEPDAEEVAGPLMDCEALAATAMY